MEEYTEIFWEAQKKYKHLQIKNFYGCTNLLYVKLVRFIHFYENSPKEN